MRWTPPTPCCSTSSTGLIDGTATYVHVVVDEAQDLSPMQCRAVARRCPLGSITVLGDLAQATTPWAPGDWTVTLAHLGHDDGDGAAADRRLPGAGEVIELANRLLPHVAVDVPPAASVRGGAAALRFAPAADASAEVRALRGGRGLGRRDRARTTRAGRVVRRARLAAGIAAAPVETRRRPAVTVVPASEAKGLEYDSVVVVEPPQIVAAEPTAPRPAPALRGADPGRLAAGRRARRTAAPTNSRPEAQAPRPG